MATSSAPIRIQLPGSYRTLRTDKWWILPAWTVFALTSFIVYSTWAALQNAYYYSAPYLSPMYSPCLAANCDRVTFPLVGDWFTLSPAFLILWAPGVFRVTCYYHREAYYRSFWGSPPGCAVQDVHDSYSGETGFPLILQNLHRYAWYLAVVFIFFLSYDALIAFRFPDGFGIGVGTLVICLNVMLLAGYTFSCHSCRHVCGGHVNQFSKAPVRYEIWRFVTRINMRHPTYAWCSLLSVVLTDLYIRFVAMGVITDIRII